MKEVVNRFFTLCIGGRTSVGANFNGMRGDSLSYVTWEVMASRQKETPNTSWPANNYRRAQADVFDWAHDQGKFAY
ncbi:hypothetical protein SASPL_111082 [Salvia splendens]|uniref:Uncharacterized protein n=1 Tax=Salvia splendens TaxID=180675 RepID=A0A8X8YA34_SALSN|nr:hypothetical protein SASPL_111082 [Salvia splendens]